MELEEKNKHLLHIQKEQQQQIKAKRKQLLIHYHQKKRDRQCQLERLKKQCLKILDLRQQEQRLHQNKLHQQKLHQQELLKQRTEQLKDIRKHLDEQKQRQNELYQQRSLEAQKSIQQKRFDKKEQLIQRIHDNDLEQKSLASRMRNQRQLQQKRNDIQDAQQAKLKELMRLKLEHQHQLNLKLDMQQQNICKRMKVYQMEHEEKFSKYDAYQKRIGQQIKEQHEQQENKDMRCHQKQGKLSQQMNHQWKLFKQRCHQFVEGTTKLEKRLRQKKEDYQHKCNQQDLYQHLICQQRLTLTQFEKILKEYDNLPDRHYHELNRLELQHKEIEQKKIDLSQMHQQQLNEQDLQQEKLKEEQNALLAQYETQLKQQTKELQKYVDTNTPPSTLKMKVQDEMVKQRKILWQNIERQETCLQNLYEERISCQKSFKDGLLALETQNKALCQLMESLEEKHKHELMLQKIHLGKLNQGEFDILQKHIQDIKKQQKYQGRLLEQMTAIKDRNWQNQTEFNNQNKLQKQMSVLKERQLEKDQNQSKDQEKLHKQMSVIKERRQIELKLLDLCLQKQHDNFKQKQIHHVSNCNQSQSKNQIKHHEKKICLKQKHMQDNKAYDQDQQEHQLKLFTQMKIIQNRQQEELNLLNLYQQKCHHQESCLKQKHKQDNNAYDKDQQKYQLKLSTQMNMIQNRYQQELKLLDLYQKKCHQESSLKQKHQQDSKAYDKDQQEYQLKLFNQKNMIQNKHQQELKLLDLCLRKLHQEECCLQQKQMQNSNQNQSKCQEKLQQQMNVIKERQKNELKLLNLCFEKFSKQKLCLQEKHKKHAKFCDQEEHANQKLLIEMKTLFTKEILKRQVSVQETQRQKLKDKMLQQQKALQKQIYQESLYHEKLHNQQTREQQLYKKKIIATEQHMDEIQCKVTVLKKSANDKLLQQKLIQALIHHREQYFKKDQETKLSKGYKAYLLKYKKLKLDLKKKHNSVFEHQNNNMMLFLQKEMKHKKSMQQHFEVQELLTKQQKKLLFGKKIVHQLNKEKAITIQKQQEKKRERFQEALSMHQEKLKDFNRDIVKQKKAHWQHVLQTKCKHQKQLLKAHLLMETNFSNNIDLHCRKAESEARNQIKNAKYVIKSECQTKRQHQRQLFEADLLKEKQFQGDLNKRIDEKIVGQKEMVKRKKLELRQQNERFYKKLQAEKALQGLRRQDARVAAKNIVETQLTKQKQELMRKKTIARKRHGQMFQNHIQIEMELQRKMECARLCQCGYYQRRFQSGLDKRKAKQRRENKPEDQHLKTGKRRDKPFIHQHGAFGIPPWQYLLQLQKQKSQRRIKEQIEPTIMEQIEPTIMEQIEPTIMEQIKPTIMKQIETTITKVPKAKQTRRVSFMEACKEHTRPEMTEAAKQPDQDPYWIKEDLQVNWNDFEQLQDFTSPSPTEQRLIDLTSQRPTELMNKRKWEGTRQQQLELKKGTRPKLESRKERKERLRREVEMRHHYRFSTSFIGPKIRRIHYFACNQ